MLGKAINLQREKSYAFSVHPPCILLGLHYAMQPIAQVFQAILVPDPEHNRRLNVSLMP
jgi:hypothetical protein